MENVKTVYGRDREMHVLDEHLEKAIAGEQQLVLLEGDAGIGKTALLQAFAARHQGQRRARFFYLSATEGEVYLPVRHAALAATNQRLYNRLGGRRQAAELARTLSFDWIAAIPFVGHFVAAVGKTIEIFHRRGKVSPLLADSAVDEDIDALIEAARRRPLVLLLDELERANPMEVLRLEKLICVADEGARILIVAAYRPRLERGVPPPVTRLLKTLPRQDELFVHCRLTPLGAQDVSGWMESRFPGAVVPESFAEKLVASTGGHPGALEDALAEVQRLGGIRRRFVGWQFDLSVTIGVGDGERTPTVDLSEFPADVVEVIQAASLLGTVFDGGTLAALLEADELDVEDRLAAAVHVGLLESAAGGGDDGAELVSRFRFAAPGTVPVIRGTIDEPTRHRLQARLAETAAQG